MITEFIKEHKKLCIIILIAIIIILIIVNVKGKYKSETENVEDAAMDETSETMDIGTELENDITAQTNYSTYVYAEE